MEDCTVCCYTCRITTLIYYLCLEASWFHLTDYRNQQGLPGDLGALTADDEDWPTWLRRQTVRLTAAAVDKIYQYRRWSDSSQLVPSFVMMRLIFFNDRSETNKMFSVLLVWLLGFVWFCNFLTPKNAKSTLWKTPETRRLSYSESSSDRLLLIAFYWSKFWRAHGSVVFIIGACHVI